MINEIYDIFARLEDETPIHSFKFGHTPIQIEYFQTTNQQGNEKWEYWQHILQLKSLYFSLRELEISYGETSDELSDAESLWPFWSLKKRKRNIPRLTFKLESIVRSIEEKTREVKYHLEILGRKYSHLKNISEDDIIKEESIYWAQRLGKQLGASHLSRILGVSESEILAVLSLPKEQQLSIFESMRQVLGTTAPMLPRNKE